MHVGSDKKIRIFASTRNFRKLFGLIFQSVCKDKFNDLLCENKIEWVCSSTPQVLVRPEWHGARKRGREVEYHNKYTELFNKLYQIISIKQQRNVLTSIDWKRKEPMASQNPSTAKSNAKGQKFQVKKIDNSARRAKFRNISGFTLAFCYDKSF